MSAEPLESTSGETRRTAVGAVTRAAREAAATPLAIASQRSSPRARTSSRRLRPAAPTSTSRGSTPAPSSVRRSPVLSPRLCSPPSPTPSPSPRSSTTPRSTIGSMRERTTASRARRSTVGSSASYARTPPTANGWQRPLDRQHGAGRRPHLLVPGRAGARVHGASWHVEMRRRRLRVPLEHDHGAGQIHVPLGLLAAGPYLYFGSLANVYRVAK